MRAELPRDRRKTTGWRCGHPQPRPSGPAKSSAGARPAQEASPPAPRLPPTDRGTGEWCPGQGSERGEVRGGSFSSLLQLNPLPSNVTKHPGPSDKPHSETGTWRLWSAARSGQKLPRHGFHFSLKAPPACAPGPEISSWHAWGGGGGGFPEESAKLSLGDNISHPPPKYLSPDSFLSHLPHI